GTATGCPQSFSFFLCFVLACPKALHVVGSKRVPGQGVCIPLTDDDLVQHAPVDQPDEGQQPIILVAWHLSVFECDGVARMDKTLSKRRRSLAEPLNRCYVLPGALHITVELFRFVFLRGVDPDKPDSFMRVLQRDFERVSVHDTHEGG